MLESVTSELRVVGVKQLRKALEEGNAKKAYLALDADPTITKPLEALCIKTGTELFWVSTMEELGKRCAIDVGASAAGILKAPK